MKSHVVGVLIMIIGSAGAVFSAGTELPLRFKGRIAAMTGPAAGQTAFLTVQVERWATGDELRRLDSILVENGESALLEAVASTESAGWFKIGSGLRYELRVISHRPTEDGGMVIRALTDRPINIREIFRSARSADYGFGVIEIVLGPDFEGSGSLIPFAKIHFNDLEFEIENFQSQSYRLMKVKPEKVKK